MGIVGILLFLVIGGWVVGKVLEPVDKAINDYNWKETDDGKKK
jgi:hypothetical protein